MADLAISAIRPFVPGGRDCALSTPPLQPWGREVAYLVGPCGELWHIVRA